MRSASLRSAVKRVGALPPLEGVLRRRGLRSTNVGRWSGVYKDLEQPEPYDDVSTYGIAAAYLADCALVEDWGCGKGWARTAIDPERYRGIDGSRSPFADVVADLVTYRSEVPGLLMRHVLEHNYRWAEILGNALHSFKERMVLILFTPLASTTHVIAYNPHIGVPDISFKLADITDRFSDDIEWSMESQKTATEYGGETILFLSRRATSR